MKTPDDIKKGLACCAESIYQCADDCPYREGCRSGVGWMAMNKDALAYIKQLEAERDALIYDIEEYCAECALCKHYTQGPYETPCNNCRHMHTDAVASMWEWRGVQKEE